LVIEDKIFNIAVCGGGGRERRDTVIALLAYVPFYLFVVGKNGWKK